MSAVWVVVVVGAATVIFKSAGPVFLGGRDLPFSIRGVVGMLAPALLAALVVTQAVGGDRRLVFDARLVGLAGRRWRSGCALRSSSSLSWRRR